MKNLNKIQMKANRLVAQLAPFGVSNEDIQV